MKLFEVIFLFESDTLFINKEHDKKTAKVKLAAINNIIDEVPNDSDRYKQLIKQRCVMLSIIRDKDYQTIKQAPQSVILYARDVIKGRWPEAEPIIMKNPYYSYSYANEVLKKRWPEAERVIKQAPQSVILYARDVIKGRWPEAEPTIMKNPYYSYSYANEVLKKRWPEAEPAIMKDGVYAVEYAKHVIMGRWPEAEPTIMKNVYSSNYIEYLNSIGITI
jgi:hypothetical protein